MSAPTTERERERDKADASSLIVGGIGVGVIGAVGAVLSGAVCPVCVVAAPALIGIGTYRRWRATREKRAPGAPRDGDASHQT